jgi:hypothetical protein
MFQQKRVEVGRRRHFGQQRRDNKVPPCTSRDQIARAAEFLPGSKPRILLLDTALDYLQQDDEAGADYQPPSRSVSRQAAPVPV